MRNVGVANDRYQHFNYSVKSGFNDYDCRGDSDYFNLDMGGLMKVSGM